MLLHSQHSVRLERDKVNYKTVIFEPKAAAASLFFTLFQHVSEELFNSVGAKITREKNREKEKH